MSYCFTKAIQVNEARLWPAHRMLASLAVGPAVGLCALE